MAYCTSALKRLKKNNLKYKKGKEINKLYKQQKFPKFKIDINSKGELNDKLENIL